MDYNTVSSLIDEIASGILMAEPADKSSIAGMIIQFQQLESMFDTQSDEVDNWLETCRELLLSVSEGKNQEPKQALAEISEYVSALQKWVKDSEKIRDDSFEGGAVDSVEGTDGPTSGSQFVLPDYVDEEVYREFISNTKYVLEDIERSALLIEKGDAGAKSDLKRKIHTLKGEAGVLALNDIEFVCHAVEDMFAEQRSPRQMADALLGVVDWIHKALDNYAEMCLPEPRGKIIAEMLKEGKGLATMAESRQPSRFAPVPDSEPLISEQTQEALLSEDISESDRIIWDEETVMLVGEFLDESEEGLNNVDQILMSFDDSGVEPEKVNALFRTFHTIKGVAGFLELKEITKLAHTTETMMDQVRDGLYPLIGPVLDLVFDSTEIMRAMLQSVREAVESNSGVKREPRLREQLGKLDRIISGEEPEEEVLPDASPDDKLGEILIQAPSLIPLSTINEALESQKETGRPLGEELVATGVAKPKQVSQALRAQKKAIQAKESAGKIKETVKVDLERVDRLVEMIGELVIVESMVVHAKEISSLASPKIRNYLSQLEKITRDLQDTGMRMRMVPVRGVFQKMARMVRDLARKSHKSVRLVTSGEGTEMDRSMVEQVTDPLVHMIRNAVDHAIEPIDVRRQLGKPTEGTVTLSAYHEGGSIIVEIADDGKGLDRDAILDKARKQGIVTGDSQLPDSEVFKLIFAPGFSTATQVTEISGRGVGMDVVKRNIESMRGRISIESEPGKGTTFKIILPLTLAIIDGMLVSCGPEQYIIPTLSIVESLQVTPGMLNSFADQGELINVRGEIFPLLRLDQLFGIDISENESASGEGLVVVLEGVGRKVGLYVDDVLTQQQVVIKSLGNGIQQTQYISGGAIMSDGTVGLILNVEEIAEIVDRRSAQHFDYLQDMDQTVSEMTLG